MLCIGNTSHVFLAKTLQSRWKMKYASSRIKYQTFWCLNGLQRFSNPSGERLGYFLLFRFSRHWPYIVLARDFRSADCFSQLDSILYHLHWLSMVVLHALEIREHWNKHINIWRIIVWYEECFAIWLSTFGLGLFRIGIITLLTVTLRSSIAHSLKFVVVFGCVAVRQILQSKAWSMHFVATLLPRARRPWHRGVCHKTSEHIWAQPSHAPCRCETTS